MTSTIIANPLEVWLNKCQSKMPLSDFGKSLRQDSASWLAQAHLPQKKDEPWRFTDLSDFLALDFQVAEAAKVEKMAIFGFRLAEAAHSCLVFVNGVYSPDLSDVSGLPKGVFVGNSTQLDNAQKEKIVKYLGKQPEQEEVFSALNNAGLVDAAIVWVKDSQEPEVPIHLLFLTQVAEVATFSQPRLLVVVEENSSLKLIESYGAIANDCSDIPREHPYFSNVVSEIYLGENAQLEHIRSQRESGDAFHLARTAVAQAKNSRYSILEVSLGGRLARHKLDIYQNAPQTETYLYGLAMLEAKQVADTHSAVYLNHPHGVVNQLHKCIVDGQAQAVFNGKIIVPRNAQLTNAAQLNRNLLLSSKARVNAKPELQITADNVKCTHGATVSQLEADELFYLRSRGLSEENARNLLIDAFAAEILEKIPYTSLLKRLSQCVACRTWD